ncbi:PD-(D/E)XK nuclease-like domain-containing protein [Vibrio parahaemolyticus]|nr:PD-(D/E)XK nuclease-like domain-containing protein [Vibrio parahaemolyticus]
MFFYRAEQKPKSKAAKDGAEVFYSYHQSEKDNQSLIKTEALDYFDAKGLDRKDYFQPKIFVIDEVEFKNRPDDSEEVSAINGFDYEDFNSNQDFVTTEDVLFSAASFILYDEIREFSQDELTAISDYMRSPGGERVREYMLTVQIACSLIATCYQDIDVNAELDIELCQTILANYPNIDEMISEAIDTLESHEIEIDLDVLEAIEKRFEQIDIEEVEKTSIPEPSKSDESPILAAIKSHPSFGKLPNTRDFVTTMNAHLGTLRSLANVDAVQQQIIEHIGSMANMHDLAVFSDFENAFKEYLQYYDDEDGAENNGIETQQNDSSESQVSTGSSQKDESSTDAEIEYPEIYESIEKRLNQRKEVAAGKVKTAKAEIEMCYGFIAPQINERTDYDLLCDKIESLPQPHPLFSAITATQLVMQCEPVEQKEQPEQPEPQKRSPRQRLASKFSEKSGIKPNHNTENEHECFIAEILSRLQTDGANFLTGAQFDEAGEKLRAALDEANQAYSEDGKAFDRVGTLENIRNVDWDSISEASKVFLNIRSLRACIRENVEQIDTAENASNEGEKTEMATNQAINGNNEQIGGNNGEISGNNEPKQAETLPNESKSLPAEQNTQSDRPVTDGDISGGGIIGNSNLLDLPDFDDEVEQLEQELGIQSFEQQLAELNEKINAIAPGASLIINDLSNELYHAADGYSKSSLDIINQDPSLLEWSRNCPIDEEKIKSFDVGSAFHTLVLEPHKFNDEYAVEPKVVNEKGEPTTKANNYWKKLNAEFLENNQNKTIITADEHRYTSLMVGSVHAHPRAKILFNHPTGEAEISIFWRDPETGLIFKIRPDFRCVINGVHFIIDLKSTADSEKFEWSVADFRYHVQDAFYTWVYTNAVGVEPVFAFCTTSKSVNCGRYKTRLVVLQEGDKLEGKAQYESNIRTLQGCIETNNWGGFEEITRPYNSKRNDITKEQTTWY